MKLPALWGLQEGHFNTQPYPCFTKRLFPQLKAFVFLISLYILENYVNKSFVIQLNLNLSFLAYNVTSFYINGLEMILMIYMDVYEVSIMCLEIYTQKKKK